MPRLIRVLGKKDSVWSTNEDRRACLRHPAKVRVACRLVTDGAAVPIGTAQVRDLSTLGIGLILPKPPGFGVCLEIELARQNGTFVRSVLAHAEAGRLGQD